MPRQNRHSLSTDGTLQPYIEVPAHRQTMVTRLKIMCDLDISETQAARRQDQV
jgi:type II secretory ATPase GspE/PulE/Tfp pilus assembly ATPase PilB-like protein